jgi:hypothetical protein
MVYVAISQFKMDCVDVNTNMLDNLQF